MGLGRLLSAGAGRRVAIVKKRRNSGRTAMMNQVASGHEGRESRLIRAFAQLADTLVDDYDVDEVLHQLVEYCVDLLAVDQAGLLFADQRGGLAVLASSSEQTRLLEAFQLKIGEGPCLDCYRTGQPVRVADLRRVSGRWPVFAAEAIKEGFNAVFAVPLRLRRQVIGAMNLFSVAPSELSEQDRRVAQALADTATIGILHERALRREETLTEQLQTALNNRTTIEQAKGVLAHAGNLQMHQAFDVLRRYARDHRTRIADLATQLASGELAPHTVLTPSDDLDARQ